VRSNPNFSSDSWFVLFKDFKAAFDRVDHNILFEKLVGAGAKTRTIDILKLLYNSYHFALSGDIPSKINSGVAQGSLVSPLLYDWYVDDLVSELSRRFGMDKTYAYADDIAVLCLGYSEIREVLLMTEGWAMRNGAQLNKKKCGILRITKRETPIGKKMLEDVAFMHEYKYLGVPLDQSFSMKFLVPHLNRKIMAFCGRIHLILHSVVGLKAEFDLWQTCVRYHFDYFAPSIALCGQLSRFETLYTKSLKKALGLPVQTPNARLLMALGVPSLTQLAAHHLVRSSDAITSRFSNCPLALSSLAEKLKTHADQYYQLRMKMPVSRLPDGTFVLDLLADRFALEKCLVGLVAGTFLTIRSKKESDGTVGSIRLCPCCQVLADQSHFLNACTANLVPREILSRSVPPNFLVEHLVDRDYCSFYKDIRCLKLKILGAIDDEEPIPEPIYLNLALAASEMAALFTKNALALFD